MKTSEGDSSPDSNLSNCARVAAEEGRFEEALGLAALLLEADPVDRDARFITAMSLLMLDRPVEARTVLDPFVAEHPDYPNAAWLRAGLLRRLLHEAHTEVLAAYDLVASVDPANLYALVERADILRAHGRYGEARDCYARIQSEEVCADATLRIEAAFNLGCVALVLGETDTARAAFQKVLNTEPEHAEAAAMLALIAGGD